jgi:hypothetical protein
MNDSKLLMRYLTVESRKKRNNTLESKIVIYVYISGFKLFSSNLKAKFKTDLI